jgi:type II secretory pathway component PulF
MTAKHIVKNWYTKEKLDKLVQDLKAGKSFEEAYGE